MAELEMQEYEHLNQNEETTYDEIKVDKGTTEINHLVFQSWSQFFRNFLLILIASLFSAGVVATVSYFTVYGKCGSTMCMRLYVLAYDQNIM